MPHFFILLLKINLVLVLFAAAYYLILRRLTYYVINRIFLAFGILFSTVYPFIDLTEFFHSQKQISQQVVAFVPKINQKVNEFGLSAFVTEHWQLISILFYIGVVLMSFRLMVQFVSLYKMHQKSQPGSVANYPVRILDEPVSPFSFWQTVYINPSLHKERELQTILEHENIHVKQWHSLDIILAELSVVFYWFNPGVWLMKKAVKENLEFITDEKILKKGVDKKAYQYSLLDVGNLTPSVAIVNNFNLSDLKKRIKMMNAKRSSKFTLSRYLLVTPVLLVITLAFTVSKKEISKHLQPFKEVLIKANVIAPNTFTTTLAPQKKTVKRKQVNNNYPTLEIKEDSVNKVTYLVNTIFVYGDSVRVNSPELFNFKRDITAAQASLIGKLKGRVDGKILAYTNDSLKATADGTGKIQNIRIEFKGTAKPAAVGNDEANKEIVVRGYGKIRGVALPPDTTKIAYKLNGKDIKAEEFNGINVESIKSVVVQKNDSPKPNEIHIVAGKRIPNK